MTKLPKSRTEYVECGKSRVVDDVWDKDLNRILLTIVGGSPPPSDQNPPPSDMSTRGDRRVQSPRREGPDEPELAETGPGFYALSAISDVTGGLLGPDVDMVFTPDFAQRLGVSTQRQAVVWNTAQVIDGQLVLDLPKGFTPSATGDMTFVIGLGQD
jgi:hypothetical protein